MRPAALTKGFRECPPTYDNFLELMREFVKSKGLDWEISLDSNGVPRDGADWNLILLTGSHARVVAKTNGFGVIDSIRTAALAEGWSAAAMAQGKILDKNVQSFIKAIVAYRCQRLRNPRQTRHLVHVYRKFFSVTRKAPWELSNEDFNRFIALIDQDVNVVPEIVNLAKIINENMLSLHCPLEPDIPRVCTLEMQIALADRKGGEKLPKKNALHELSRIVFQEIPRSHQHAIRFCVVRILILTGLRLNEVLLLPRECLIWESHIDVVSGRPAGEIGGISKSLRIRYFAEKHKEGGPAILVEAHQWVPERFHASLVETINLAVKATEPLRKVLTGQLAAPSRHPKSDLRKFKTTAGKTISTADLLFLVIFNSKELLPKEIPADAPITLVAQSSLYTDLGVYRKGPTIFERYGAAEGRESMKVTPKSLRHTMNTELFRSNVPDTVITHHFGRQSVVQSFVYDHRTLAERLKFVQLPAAATKVIRPGTTEEMVAKMVVSGLVASSHIAKSFHRIQHEHDETTAFQYLAVNSDGFHVTPYGFCVNSFSLNPCARHLKCFDNCRHFVGSGAPEHKISLQALKTKLIAMRNHAASKPPTTLGRKNQIAHADRLLIGVGKALEAQPNQAIFPRGTDYSASNKDLFS